MAQALYTEHPLDEYLKESGDVHERLPGSFTDTSDEEPVDSLMSNACVDLSLPSSPLAGTVEALRHWSTVIRNIFPSPSDDFAERFKYDLISSSLLSTSVSPSPISPHPRSAFSSPNQRLPGELHTTQQDHAGKVNQDLKSLSSAFVFVGLAALMNQHRIAALLALITSVSFAKAPSVASTKQTYIPQMFESLETLKVAGYAWDAAVNEAIMIIEGDERSVYYTPSSSAQSSPSSALRVALHSTLLTTQHQCDNVRPLLAALASPVELSQLSEMYAPPTPAKASYTLQPRPSTPRKRNTSISENGASGSSPRSSMTPAEKRQTWNGSNGSPFGVNARTSSAIKKKDRRRSDLSTLLDAQRTPHSTLSSPPRSPSLTQVLEADEEEEHREELSLNEEISERDLSRDNFGTAALFLRRKRRTNGAEILGLTSSRSVPSLRESLYLSPPSSISSSRFTSLSSSRHPLSITALHHALHGALASRRYACAHLLALRFTEDTEDETYWENVRSVTALLTSTLEDATARLNEAFAEAENFSRQESQPTPEASPMASPTRSPAQELFASDFTLAHASQPTPPSQLSKPSDRLNLCSPSFLAKTSSFAPAPNGVARFASHIDAISSSLNDAKEHLLESVEELRDAQNSKEFQISDPEGSGLRASEESILQTYELLRKELGIALRECERGKTALLDVFESRRRRDQPLREDECEPHEDGPSFGHVRTHTISGSSKDSNDRTDLDPLTPNDGSPVIPMLSSLDDSAPERDADDATQHLLLSASTAHLPPPGLEQIFESEAAALTAFSRERSKLPREERIKRMRAKRESMTGRGLAAQLEDDQDGEPFPTRKGWGPGMDVVEELKDVIWKVGERRRRMTEGSSETTPSLIPIPVVGLQNRSNDYDTSLCSL